MKRITVFALVFILILSMSSVASAEPAQVAYGILEEAMSGDVVRVMVDVSDGWSVGFHPMAFYLFDQPAYNNEGDFMAYGTLLSDESFDSLVEGHADSERADKDGYVVFTESDGRTTFVAPVGENLHIMLMVDPSADVDAVWERVSYEQEDYSFADPVQTASGVLADIKDDSLLVDVTLDLKYGWSARFLPSAFYLFNEDTPEGDFDVYGTLLNETDYALIMESHADDETLEEKDGYLMYETEDYTGIIAPVTENEYITLIVYGIYDAEAMWERVSYKLF